MDCGKREGEGHPRSHRRDARPTNMLACAPIPVFPIAAKPTLSQRQRMPSPRYSLRLVAAPSDIDELGHVSNLVYVRWVQEAAKSHSAAVGFDHARYVQEGGVFVVRKHVVEYLAPTFAGEEIDATTWIETWSGVTSERHTELVRRSDGKQLARAVTTWVFVSTTNGAPKRVPKHMLEAFAQPVTQSDAEAQR